MYHPYSLPFYALIHITSLLPVSPSDLPFSLVLWLCLLHAQPEGSHIKTTTGELLPSFVGNGGGGRDQPSLHINPGGLKSGLKMWTSAQVCEWMEHVLGMPEHAPTFRQNKVDGVMLIQLDDEDLEGLLNVSLPLHRRKIMRCITELRDACTL